MMWTPLPSPSPLPKVAPTATSVRTQETHGGFARALQQAAVHDSAAELTQPEDRPSKSAPVDGTPARSDDAAKAAQNRAAAARLERRQAAAAQQPPGTRMGTSPAPDEPASGAAPTTQPKADETPSDDAALPEASAVGALLSQLQAASAATTPPTHLAHWATGSMAAAQTASARAGRSATATTTTIDTTIDTGADGPGARRAMALALGETPSPTTSPGQHGVWASAADVAASASSRAQQAFSAESADRTFLTADPEAALDTQPLSTQTPAGANLGLPSAPPAGGHTDLSSTAGEARLSASLSSPEFGPQLGAQITTFVRDGLEHARLQLNPANMGPVLVQIQLDGQTAQVHLSAEHAWTRQALQDAMPQLASLLREAGLTLSGGGVSEQAQQGRQAPSETPSDRTSPAEPTEGSPRQPGLPAARRGVVDLVA